jgi:hypothetical protein
MYIMKHSVSTIFPMKSKKASTSNRGTLNILRTGGYNWIFFRVVEGSSPIIRDPARPPRTQQQRRFLVMYLLCCYSPFRLILFEFSA